VWHLHRTCHSDSDFKASHNCNRRYSAAVFSRFVVWEIEIVLPEKGQSKEQAERVWKSKESMTIKIISNVHRKAGIRPLF
jgi:hypothetical protein